MDTASRGPAETDGGTQGALARLVDDPSSRKRFLRMVGGAGAVGAFSTLVAACSGPAETSPPVGVNQRDPGTIADFGPGDRGIVNFALFLEYIENDFYDRIINENAVTDPGLRNTFTTVRDNENEHLRALQRTADQMGRSIRKPDTDFDRIFAGGQGKILSFAANLENIGSATYLGQAARILDREVLAAALTIHTVEARHAAAFNKLAGRSFAGNGHFKGMIPNGAFAVPITMQEAFKQVRPYFKGPIPGLESYSEQ